MLIDQFANKTQEQKERAYAYAVYLLSLKLRTEGEIKAKLKIKYQNEKIIEEVIEELKGLKYLDDERYAQVFLENLKKYKNFGYFGIKKKFIEKRLPSQLIEKTLSEGLSEEEELVIAKRLVKKYVVKPHNEITASSDLYGARQKLAKKLASKGFRTGVISKVVF